MAKEKKGSGIQQAAGLIRYFDEESEDAIQISKGIVYAACVVFSVAIYLSTMEYGHGWATSFLELSDYSSPVKSTTGNSSSSRCEASTSSSSWFLSHHVRILELIDGCLGRSDFGRRVCLH